MAVVRRIVCQNPPWAVRAVLVPAMGLAMFPAGALAQDSTAADRAALEALYEATGAADWADSTNWKTDAPLSQWYGVGTGDRGRVMELELGNNGLTGSIPPELADLADLERLFLHGNGLTGLPRELGRLVNLTDLDLRWNNLTGPVPTWLGSLVNLRRLDLGDNGLTGPLPRELGNLVNVEWLMLHGNNLTGPVPAWLGSLVNLRLLFLGYNGLTGPIPRELANLVNLTFLALEWNALTGPVPASLGSLANLDALHLDGNDLAGPVPAELGSLANLGSLRLAGNWGLSGPLPPGLRQAPLEELHIFVTQACAPAAWRAWLATIEFSGPLCGAGTDITIDVAVVYTPAAREAAGGGAAIEAEIDCWTLSSRGAGRSGDDRGGPRRHRPTGAEAR